MTLEPKPKIVVFAPLHADGETILEREGYAVCRVGDGDGEAILREMADAVGAVASNNHHFGDAAFEHCPRLRVVGRMGVGVDNIDLEAATRHGVQILNTPEPIIEPVAEHTILLMLAVTRRLAVGDRHVRAGKFREPADQPDVELRGKTLGLVGFGNTGRRVAEIARLGFGMRILYHDLVEAPEAEKTLRAERRELDALLRESDVVSAHVNLSSATREMFGARAFQLMKSTAYFINVSRGGVVDETALVEALRNGSIAGAGLDVFAVEPPPAEHPLWEMDSVVLTPHRAGSSVESRLGCSMVVEDVVRVLRGDQPRHPVNRL